MARSAKEHAEVILKAILPDRLDYLDLAVRDIGLEQIPDPTIRALFGMIFKYLETCGSVLPREAMLDMVESANSNKAPLFAEMYDLYAADTVDPHEFNWSLSMLKELHAERSVGETLTEGMEILVRGVEQKDGETIKGQEAARAYVVERFSSIDKGLRKQEASEGDARDEYEDMLADYKERKRLRDDHMADGIMFGIPELDDKIGGLQRGELDLLVGYSSSGKTSLATVQLAWNAAINQGKNVIIATTETLRPQIRRKLLSRHSRKPSFGLENGLNSKDIKNGTLTFEQEKALNDVAKDFTSNKEYGHCYILQVPKGSNISYVESHCARLQRDFPLDLCIIDYIALFRAERKRQTAREELASLIVESKQFATSFNSGKGIPVISPWQISRAAWDAAQQKSYYTMTALAETAEAERSADIIVSILEPLENDDRYATLKAQILKNRDGETDSSIMLSADYATSYFTSVIDNTDMSFFE